MTVREALRWLAFMIGCMAVGWLAMYVLDHTGALAWLLR